MIYKLALLTPLHPQKTGIADYIEEMLPYIRSALGPNYLIDIFVDGFSPNSKDIIDSHRILNINDFERLYSNYDLTIYQMGNNKFHLKIYQLALKYPGIVILHDFAIHHLVAAFFLDVLKDDTAYFNEVGFNHGEAAKTLAYQRAVKGELGLWETDAFNYPMNRRLVKNSLGVVVFSQMAKERLEAYGDRVPIHRIYLHCGGEAELCSCNSKWNARKRLGIKIAENEVMIGVFGFVGKAKRPYSIIRAVKRIQDQGKKVHLFFVGELQQDCKDIPQELQKLNLTSCTKVTGYTTMDEFLDYLKASDICISLRNPTMGETSGVLMRALSMGKPSIVQDIGSFRELPSEIVIKISTGDTEEDELTDAIAKLINEEDFCKQMGMNAFRYAKEHLEIQSTARNLTKFIMDAVQFNLVKNNNMYQAMRENMVTTYLNFGYTDDALLKKMARALSEVFREER